MKKLLILLLIPIYSYSYYEKINPKCEEAITAAAIIGWNYSEGKGSYKAMIKADNNVKRVCKK